MDLVGLVSGGKDSVYNMVEAVRLGHRVVCLANLHPAAPPSASSHALEEAPQELDSWMYQTVGWNVLPALCEALGLPLHRRATRGVAVHTGMAYPADAAAAAPGGAAGEVDEVEDLHQLLLEVLAAHPSVRGVAVGAILSTYQRVRVESVCARLGLVPVALLWQREQRGLLQDMTACGLRALLVKVASHGLTPERHLGREAGALLPALLRLHAQLGLHICGEGGEYETLALDSPLHVRGVVEVGERRVVAAPGSATAHLHILEAALRARTAAEEALLAPHALAWDWRQRAAAAGAGAALRAAAAQPPPLPPFVFTPLPQPPADVLAQVAAGGAGAQEALPTAPAPHGAALHGDTLLLSLSVSLPTAAAAALLLLQQLRCALAGAASTLGDVVNLHLALSDMAHFAQVNGVFQAAFGSGTLAQHPPSRSCVHFSGPGSSSSSTVRIDLQALCVIGSARSAALGHGSHRRTLLVASLSKWAPLCIGPYAQCVSLDDALVYPAGQIGLLPETMALVPGGLAGQLQQALLNLARVCSCAASAIPCALSMVVFVQCGAGGMAEAEACVVQEGVGAWDGGRGGGGEVEEGEGEGEGEEQWGEEYEFSLGPFARSPPRYHQLSPPSGSAPSSSSTMHPCAIIPVAALPRGAAVEVEALCLTGEAISLFGGLSVASEDDMEPSSSGSAGGAAAQCASTDRFYFCSRARLLPGCVGSAWVGATGPWGVGQWQRLACWLAQRVQRLLVGGAARLGGGACSWSVRAFYDAYATCSGGSDGSEVEAGVDVEREGLAGALKGAFEGLAAQVVISMVPLGHSAAQQRVAVLRPMPGARAQGALPGQRTLLLQVTAYNVGALRGQLWLRRAYKSCGVAAEG